jgi:hypothetical protein
MDALEVAWLAGLLEGEGSFMAPSPSQPTQPRITVQMCDADVISRVGRCFGVNYHLTDKRHPEKWKQSFRVHVKGRKAIELMRLIYPFMSKRRKAQIDRALKCAADARVHRKSR